MVLLLCIMYDVNYPVSDGLIASANDAYVNRVSERLEGFEQIRQLLGVDDEVGVHVKGFGEPS